MKSSPETICGALSNMWKFVTIKDLVDDGVVELQTGPFGTMLHASAYCMEGTPVVAVKNISDNKLTHDDIPKVDTLTVARLARYQLKEGDILFGRKGSVERRALIRKEEEGWIQGSDCIRLRITNKKVDPKYISYIFGSQQYRNWIMQNAQGATMPSLNQEIIGRITIQLPDLKKQKRIASILGSLDDKIELNRKQNEMLEAMSRALFQSWFVDFDPVMDNAIEAKKPIPAELADKAARRKIAKGKLPVLPKEIKKLFPSEFEPSPLGPIPKGWKAGILNDCLEIVGGGTPKTSECSFWGGDIPWFSVVDAPVDSDVFVIDTEKKITQAGLNNSSTKILPEKTTIISARGTVGKCAIVGCPMAFNQSCYGLLPKDGKHFYYVYFMTRSCVDILQQSGHGSVFNTITRNTFESINVVVPKEDALNVFEKKVESFLDKIKNNIYQSRALGQLRDTLLPKLLSGEIELKENKCEH